MGSSTRGQAGFRRPFIPSRERYTDPIDASIHTNLGNLYIEMQELPKARSSHQKALQIDPRLLGCHANLGIVLGNLWFIDEAGLGFQAVVKLNPHHQVAHRNLGVVKLRQGKAQAAKSSLKAALPLDPKD